MANMTDAELDAAYAKYQASQAQPSSAALSGPALDDAYAKYLAQSQGGASSSQPTTIDVNGPVSVQQQPNQSQSNLHNIVNWAKDQAKSALFGGAQTGIDAAAGTQDLVGRGIQQVIPSYQPLDVNIDLASQAPDQTTANMAGLASGFLLPGEPLMKAAKNLKQSLAIGGGLGAGYGAAFGAANNPNSNIAKDAAMGTALPIVLAGASRAIPAGLNYGLQKIENKANSPSNPYSSVRSPEQAKRILEAGPNLGVGELPLSIGALTNSKGYNYYYNVGSKLPFAGQAGKMEEVVGKGGQAATNLYNGLFEGKGANIQKTIGDINEVYTGLKKPFEDNKEGTGIYQKFFKKTDQAGIKGVQRPNVQQRVQQELSALKEAEDNNLTHYLKTAPSEVKNLLKDLSRPIGKTTPEQESKIIDEYGKPFVAKEATKENDFGLSKLKEERTKIRDMRDKQEKGSPEYRLFNDLYNAADKDISYNLEKSGKKELKSEFDKITNDYKTKVVPFQEIQDVLRGDYKDSKAVVSSLLDQRNREALSLLPPKIRKQLAGHKLINAVNGEEVNSSKLIKGYNSLDPSDKELVNTLLSKEDQKKFESLSAVNEVVSDYKSQNKPISNSSKVVDWMTKIGLGGAGTLAVLNPALMLKSAGAAGAALGANRGILNTMSNPNILKAYANPALRGSILNNMNPLGGLSTLMPPGAVNYMMKLYNSQK